MRVWRWTHSKASYGFLCEGFSPSLPALSSSLQAEEEGIEASKLRVCLMGLSQVQTKSKNSSKPKLSLSPTRCINATHVLSKGWEELPGLPVHHLRLHQHVRRIFRCIAPTHPLFLDYPSPTADDEYGEKSVSVSLDGQEAEITFIDHPSNEMSVSCHYEYVLVCIYVCNLALSTSRRLT